MCWHSRLKTSDRADLGSNRPSLCELRSWMHGRSYFTVTLLRERGPSLRDPYARVRARVLRRASYVSRGSQGVSETWENTHRRNTCLETNRIILYNRDLCLSRSLYIDHFRKKQHSSCNLKFTSCKMSCLIILVIIFM